MKKFTGIVIGALLIAVGVIYVLNTFGISDVRVSLDGWWTLFIIVPCLEGVLTHKDKTSSFIGLIFGILLLLAAQNVFDYSVIWKLIAPVILIAIGIKMIRKYTAAPKENTTAIGTKKHIDYSGTEITAAKIATIFGGTTCNLTDAEIKTGSQVHVLCIFGGADIIVPENVRIRANTFSLFGGVADKRKNTAITEDSPTLCINGFCIFGSADIK